MNANAIDLSLVPNDQVVHIAKLASNGDVLSVSSAVMHDDFIVQIEAMGMIVISDENALAMKADPSAWNLSNGERKPRVPLTSELEALARARRAALLAGSDWTGFPDTPLSDDLRALWRIYRQALRDVPDQPDFPKTIVWPTMPNKETN